MKTGNRVDNNEVKCEREMKTENRVDNNAVKCLSNVL